MKENSNLKKTIIAVLVLPVILANCLIPKDINLELDHNALSGLIDNGSSVLNYASLAVIPLKIVNELFASEQQKGSCSGESRKQDKEKRNTSNDLFTFGLNKTINKNGGFKSENYKQFNALLCGFKQHDGSATCKTLPLEPFSGPGVFLLFLALFILLPRSGIEDWIRATTLRISNTAAFYSRVFLFYAGSNSLRGYNENN
jgi:hypothetical protein